MTAEEIIFCDMPPWHCGKEKGSGAKKSGRGHWADTADNQTDTDALPISARNLDRPHYGARENSEKTSYEWQGVTGCHSCDTTVLSKL